MEPQIYDVVNMRRIADQCVGAGKSDLAGFAIHLLADIAGGGPANSMARSSTASLVTPLISRAHSWTPTLELKTKSSSGAYSCD